MSHTIITLEQARAERLNRYFTGRPCRHGHIAERYVNNQSCISCLRSRTEIWKRTDRGRGWKKDYQQKSEVKERQRQRANRGYWANVDRKRKEARERQRTEHAKKLKRARRATETYKQQARDYSKRYRAGREEKLSQKTRDYYKANPHLRRIYQAKRKAKQKSVGGEHTKADIIAILKAQRNKCAYCRVRLRRGRMHIDHIVPLSRGGSNHRANLQATCPTCNQKKKAKDPLDFSRELGLLL